MASLAKQDRNYKGGRFSEFLLTRRRHCSNKPDHRERIESIGGQGEMTSQQLSRGQLAAMALTRLLLGFIILMAMLLLSAGTMAYWEAWTYITVLLVPLIFVFAYLLVNDPKLLERRMRTKEKDAKQTRIVLSGSVSYVLTFLVSGFDRRFGLSHVPIAAVIVADVLVFLGYSIFIRVLRENSYASRVIEVEEGQRVVTTGPYSIVRHPMYLAVLVMYLFTPVALGSWWALIAALPLIGVLVARIRNEEQQLLKELKGYQEYTQITKYRLIPGVW